MAKTRGRKDESAALLEFKTRRTFRNWLERNHSKSEGIWVRLEKGSKSLSANDALEEALCFGWIDGIMKSIDSSSYKKYFSRRKDTANWSDKNSKIYAKLLGEGLMTPAGTAVFGVDEGQRTKRSNLDSALANVETLGKALLVDAVAARLLDEQSPSRRKQLSGFYCEARTEETRLKRRAKIIEALKSGNRGMLY